jgi:alpha-aminoadipate/glutamate carrier protein LysW
MTLSAQKHPVPKETEVSITAECVVCAEPIAVGADVEKAEIVPCDACGQEHEVAEVGQGGVVLAAAPEVEEDWGE